MYGYVDVGDGWGDGCGVGRGDLRRVWERVLSCGRPGMVVLEGNGPHKLVWLGRRKGLGLRSVQRQPAGAPRNHLGLRVGCLHPCRRSSKYERTPSFLLSIVVAIVVPIIIIIVIIIIIGIVVAIGIVFLGRKYAGEWTPACQLCPCCSSCREESTRERRRRRKRRR